MTSQPPGRSHEESHSSPTPALRPFAHRFGDQLSVAPHVRSVYGYDASGFAGLPDAVLFPHTVEDLQDAAKLARETGVPLVARGSGTGLSAGAVPERGGIVMSFEHMRSISEVDVTERTVWTDPGVVNQSLDALLAPLGLFYPPDPSSHRVSSIGGNVAENSGGPHAVKYGITGFHVRRVELVDANGAHGTFVTGELQPSSDLASLVVGSEGTLGLLSRVQLSLEPRPASAGTMLVSFGSAAAATDLVSAVLAAGKVPACLEIIDRNTIEVIEEWGAASYPAGADVVLLIDVDGSPAEVEAQKAGIEQLAHEFRALEVVIARDEVEREALWLGRRSAYAVLARRHRRIFIQDITVPRSRLTTMMTAVQEIASRYGLHTATVGHAGDGNLHPDFPYDPDDDETVARVHAANDEVLQACVALDGSITGEHGIGSDKLAGLPLMYGPAELGLMAGVKRALDPHNILNPGKAVLLEPDGNIAATAATPAQHRDAASVESALNAARKSRRPLQLSVDELRGIEVDEENLVIHVGAGDSFAEIDRALASSRLCLPISPLREGNVARALLFNDYGVDHLRHGLFRHALLCATYVTGEGLPVRMGRPVVKNVAGYDLYRLLIGSRGKFGVPISFIFRLVPRIGSVWATKCIAADSLAGAAAGLQPLALFSVPHGDEFRAFARLPEVPEGWTQADDCEGFLRTCTGKLAAANNLLDLAVPPSVLGMVLARLPRSPEIVLPAAARVLCRLEHEEADDLVRGLRGDKVTPIRAAYGPSWEPLLPPDPLVASWERALAGVFDPESILTEWLAAT